MYAYDTSEPFGTSLGFAYPKGAATVTPISFNANGSQAAGILVMPQGDGPFPVVVWAPGHGVYEGAAMWLPDALKLAKAGYAGFLLEEPSTVTDKCDAFDEGKGFIDYVIQASRALDLLATMSEIDAERIGFVGWSMGTLPGVYLSGLDERIKAFVFASTTSWTAAEQADAKAHGVPPTAYVAQSSIFDPGLYFRRNKTAAFLFMWGKDELTPVIKAWYLSNAPKHAIVRLHASGTRGARRRAQDADRLDPEEPVRDRHGSRSRTPATRRWCGLRSRWSLLRVRSPVVRPSFCPSLSPPSVAGTGTDSPDSGEDSRPCAVLL